MTTIERLQDHEVDAAGKVIAQALHFSQLTDEELATWIRERDINNFLVIRRAGELAAVSSILPMGQWFGGQAVPTGGISTVGIAPQFRGQGLGKTLLQATLEAIQEACSPLASLYPATTAFYRTLDFERAGVRRLYELPLTALPRLKSTATLSPAEPDLAAFAEVYRPWAQWQNGLLERSEVLWKNALNMSNPKTYRYWINEADGRRSGYVVFTQGIFDAPVRIVDWCAQTPAALRALITFLAGHSTMAGALIWPGMPTDLLRHLLPEQERAFTWKQLEWMLRIVDLPGALQRRGYAAGLNAEIHLAVEDARMPANAGRWVLQVAAGQATVERGGTGRVTLSMRDLAALYTSWLTPQALSLCGDLRGSANDLAALAAVFAGPAPWLLEMF